MKCKCLQFRAEIHFYHEDHHESWRSFVRRLEQRHSNVLYHNRILLYSSQKRHKRCVNGSTIPDKRCSPLAENDFRRHSNGVVALLFVRQKYVTESFLLKESVRLTIIRFYDRIERSNKAELGEKENNSRWSSGVESIYFHILSTLCCQKRNRIRGWKKKVAKVDSTENTKNPLPTFFFSLSSSSSCRGAATLRTFLSL